MPSEPVVPGTPRVVEGPVVLRPFTLADVPFLADWTPDARFLVQWAGTTLRHPPTSDQFAELFEQDPEQPTTMAWQIEDATDARPLGHIELTTIDRAARSAHVSRALIGSPAARGKGLGGTAIRAVLRVAADRLGLREVTLSVFAFNAPALACYEREGFQRMGIEQPTVVVGDEEWQPLGMTWRARE